MNKALRVVFLEDDSTAYVECPVCMVGGRERNYCWWCEGLEWEKACNWEWSLSVPGNVEELGGSEKTVDLVRDLTVTCPAWLDPKTGERRPDSIIPPGDMMYLDKEVGGFTSAPQADRPARNGLMEFLGCCADESGDPMEGCGQATRIGGLEAEVAQLRAKLAEAEAFIARLVDERTQLWIKVSAHEHVLGKVVGGFNGFLDAVRHAEGFLQGDAPKAPDEVDS
jgi:hypothetical protein